MRRLRDLQITSLTAGEATLPCRVIARGGDQAVLMAEDRVPAALVLPAEAVLGFETPAHPVMLNGIVDRGPVEGTLRFTIADAVGLFEHRLQPRLPMECEVEAASLQGPTATVRGLSTADLGAGGTFVNGLEARRGERFALRIVVPGLVDPVRCTAIVVHASPEGAALMFEDIDPPVAEAIQAIVYKVRVALARRAALPQRARRAA